MNKSPIWTEEENAILTEMYEAGADWADLARELPRRTVTTIQRRSRFLGLTRVAPEAGISTGLQRATRLHLLDLKRAGHSPRRTELHVPADGSVPLRIAPALAHSSGCGSSAALCEEVG